MCVLRGNTRPSEGVLCRGVVVRERGGTPFRQIFWSRNGAPANIVGHRWNANTEAFQQITSYSLGWLSISLFSGPNCPQMRYLASKISKKFPGVTPPGPLSGRGRLPPAPTLSTATRRVRGRKLSHCCDLGLVNHSPKSKFTTTPLVLWLTLCDIGGYTRPSEGVLWLWHCVI